MSTTTQTICLYWQYIQTRKKAFYIISIFSPLAVLSSQFLPPLIVASAFNKLSSGHFNAHTFWPEFGPLLIAYAALDLAGLFFWRVTVWILWNFEIQIKRDLAMHSFDFLVNQTQNFHNNRFAGALVSQTTKFVNAFERLFDTYTFDILTNITAFIATIVILLPRAPQFTLAFLGVSLAYFALLVWRTRKQQPYNVAEASAESSQTAQLADVLANSNTVKMYAHERHEISLFGRRTNNVLTAGLKLRNVDALNRTMYNMLTNTMSLLAFALGIYLVAVHNANVGVLYLITSYTFNLIDRLWQLSQVMRQITRGFGDAHDMTEILQLKTEVVDMPDAKPFSLVRGDLRLEHVQFAYPEQPDKNLFEEINLHIKPGEKVGLVGPSGSGKTTLTKLLLRFMDIQGGSIVMDGHDIADVRQTDLRRQIAYVPQEPLLFHRTIRENIAYGELNASDQTIEAVAKMASAHDFIVKLPQGYDTLVGERGVKLSGGQRQRVAIARAMLKNAPILVLDEATSALDSESEVLIQAALWKLMEGRTAIVIAHRLSTIQKMDRIIVLDDGKIVEEGSHKELLNRKDGTYAKLWAHQSGGFIEE